MPTGLIQEYRDTVFTEFNSELRPWRVYTTSIYHDPALATDLSYLSATSSYDANSNTLNIEAINSDINFYTTNTFKTNFNNAVSMKGTLDIEGTLNIPSDGALNLAGDINSQGTSFLKTLKFGDTYTHTTLPIGRGLSGQFLSTNGDGVADWIDGSEPIPSIFGLVEPEKTVIVDGAKDISGFRSITMSGQFRGGGNGSGSYSYTIDINGNVTGLGSVECGDISMGSGDIVCDNITAAGKIECGEVSITTAGHLRGPSVFVIDPAGYGTIDGTVKILGNLEIDGTTTTINSTTLDIADYRILLGSNATNDPQTFGAGIEVHSIGGVNNKTFTYEAKTGDALSDYWESNIDISAEGMTTTDLITQTIKIGETTVTEATLGLLANAEFGIVSPSLGVVVDANKDISGFGNIKAIGFIEAGKDKNTASFLGRAAIGYLGINDMASFAHIDNNSIDDFALMQSATGTTFLHAKAGNHINFRVGTSGQNSMTCHENGFVHVGLLNAAPTAELHVNGSIIGDDITCSAGTDISCVFGQAKIGFIGFGNWAGFSHIDVADTDGYGLIQSSAGVTILNAADTKHIEFKIKNVEKMRLTTDGDLGIGTTTPDASLSVVGNIKSTGRVAAGEGTDISCIFGLANIGYIGSSLIAGFSHIDHNNFTDFALAQSFAGYTILNAKTGFDITFGIGMVMKMNLTSTGLGIGHNFARYGLDVAGETMLRVMSDSGAAGKLLFGCTGGFSTTTDNRSHAIESKSAVGPADNYLKFLVHDGATSLSDGRTEVMTMTGDGHVGIGLNNPTKELEVFGDILCSGTIEGLNIKLTNIDVGKDSDVTGYIGRAAIGKVGIGSAAPNSNFWSDQASFAHIDNNTQLNFAIKQDANGSTNINASTTSVMSPAEKGRMQFSIGLVEKMRLTNNGLGIGTGTGGQYKDGGSGPDASLSVVGGNIKVTGGVAPTIRAGESMMGSGMAGGSVAALFGHESMLSNSDSALVQVKGFGTRLNCKSGQTIQFRTDGVTEWARFHNNGSMSIGNTTSTHHALNVTGSIKASAGFEMGGDLIISGIVDAGNKFFDISCNFGTARVGYMNIVDWAGFAHIDSATSTSYALLQSSDGKTILNAADAKQIEFKINDDEKMRLTSDGRMGIGLSNPTKMLEVDGDISGATIIEVGKNTNTASFFGKARIGYFNQTNWAGFGHLNNSTYQTVALIQSDTGNTQLNAHADKSIRLSIGGNSKMAIDGTGNVGIGITNPSEKLHVEDSILVNAWHATTTSLTTSEWNTKNSRIIFLETTQEQYFGHYGTSGVHNHNADDITLEQAIALGDSAIGQNPRELATLRETIRGGNNGIFFRNGFSPSGTSSTLLYANSIMPYSHSGNNVTDGMSINASDGVSICTGSNLRQERFRVDTNGNVGIGTTSPTEKLEVIGNVLAEGTIGNTVTGINGISSYNLWNVNSTLLTELKNFISTHGQRYNADGSDGWGSTVKFTVNTSLTANGGIALWNETFKLNVDAEYGISLRTGISNPVERLKVHNNGNVGIGLTNPTEKLEVIGDISCSADLHVTGTSSFGGGGSFGNAALGSLSTYAKFHHKDVTGSSDYALLQSTQGETYLNTKSGYHLYFRENNSTNMMIKSGGNVGIGTTSPESKLVVRGPLDDTPTILGVHMGYTSANAHRNNLMFVGNHTSRILFNAGGNVASVGEIQYYMQTNIMSFTTNSINRIQILGNGNVGIGLTNPTEKLEVIGDISGSGAISAGKSKDVSAYLGYAKIGYNGSWTSQASFGHEDVAAGSAAINQSSGGATTIGTIGGGVGGSTGALINFVGNDSTIMMAHADNDGGRLGIGIGATYPTEKLEVDGNIKVSGGGSFANAAIGSLFEIPGSPAKFHHKDITGSSDYALLQSSAGETALNTKNGYNLYFRENLNNNMMIKSGGNVGIGTSTPREKLHIYGGTTTKLIIQGTEPGESHLVLATSGIVDDDTMRKTAIVADGINSWKRANLKFVLNSDANNNSYNHINDTKMIIENNGNVGIGTLYPVARLHVNGYNSYYSIPWYNVVLNTHSSSFGMGGESRVSIYASHGIMSSTGYFQGSDDRIKSYETPLALGLDEIIQLEPKRYLKHPEFLVPVDDETGSTLPIDASGNLYKMEIDGSGNNVKVPMYAENEYGLISQEMLLIPGMELLVTEDNTENKIKNVNYIGLIPILINGIKELKTITETQAATIAALDSRLTASLDAQAALIATLTTRLNELGA